MQITAILSSAPEGGYIALDPEADSTSQGGTAEEAIENLREAVLLYLDQFPSELAPPRA